MPDEKQVRMTLQDCLTYQEKLSGLLKQLISENRCLNLEEKKRFKELLYKALLSQGMTLPIYFVKDRGWFIFESVQTSISQQSTDRQITVSLNPPELGKVLIRFQQQEAELTGLMEVNKAQTRFEIEQALPQIIRNLADCGIQIKRLEVTLSNEQQTGQGTLGNQSLQSDGTQQQYSANPGTAENDTDINESNEWLARNNSYENLSELQEALITDGSINLLI